MKKELETFIVKNKLKFTIGRRNSDSVIIIGYALHLGFTDVDEIFEILCKKRKKAVHFKIEFLKIFNYAKKRSYGKYWLTDDAKSKYIF